MLSPSLSLSLILARTHTHTLTHTRIHTLGPPQIGPLDLARLPLSSNTSSPPFLPSPTTNSTSIELVDPLYSFACRNPSNHSTRAYLSAFLGKMGLSGGMASKGGREG